MYWVKFIAALAMGFAAANISLSLQSVQGAVIAIMAAALIYVILSAALPKLFTEEVQALSKRKIYLNGLGTYIGIFLISWIIFFNIIA